jgi:hypothetical protein
MLNLKSSMQINKIEISINQYLNIDKIIINNIMILNRITIIKKIRNPI